jgi:hypothetical protein
MAFSSLLSLLVAKATFHEYQLQRENGSVGVLRLLGLVGGAKRGKWGCAGFTTSVLTLSIKRRQKNGVLPTLPLLSQPSFPNFFINLFHEMLRGRIPYILNWLLSNVFGTPFAIGVVTLVYVRVPTIGAMTYMRQRLRIAAQM